MEYNIKRSNGICTWVIKRQNNAISGRIDNKQNICKAVIRLWPKVGNRVWRFVEGQHQPIRGPGYPEIDQWEIGSAWFTSDANPRLVSTTPSDKLTLFGNNMEFKSCGQSPPPARLVLINLGPSLLNLLILLFRRRVSKEALEGPKLYQ